MFNCTAPSDWVTVTGKNTEGSFRGQTEVGPVLAIKAYGGMEVRLHSL